MILESSCSIKVGTSLHDMIMTIPDHTDDHVGDGQREEEVVGNGLQLLVQLEAHHHHQVSGDGDEGEGAAGNAHQERLEGVVGIGLAKWVTF